MAPSDIDFYKVLGLGREATNDDIKKSFRKLARELHPDKNMNNPQAKENFQQLQQAYDTLRDEFERSKYNGSNPYHGRAQPGPTPRSTTASRYASAPKPSTPSWASGSWGDGYTGGGYPSSTRTKPKAPTARDFTEHFGTGTRSRPSGYEYNNYKAPMDDDEFDDPYKTPGSYSYDPYASTAPRGESAYAKTAGRKAAETPGPRPKSTTGTTPYAAAQGAGFDLKAYVRQKQEQELAEKRTKEEAERRVWEAEEKVKEELRRAKEDQRRAKEELRKEEEAAARRKKEAKAFSAATGTYDDTGYTYTYGKPSSSSSRSQEDEANRRADEKMAGRKVKTPASKKTTKTKARTVTPDKYPSPFDVYDATPGGDADGEAESAKKGYFARGRHSVPNFDFGKPTEKQRAQKAHMEDRSNNEPEYSYSFKPATKATPRRKSTKNLDDDTPVNPFKFQDPATPEASEASKAFTKNINLNFSAEARAPFSTFTANSSPSPPTSGYAPPPKPTSHSNLFPTPPYIPSASVPPARTSRPTLAKKASFQKDLYENLVKTAEPFAFQPTNTSPKKRSTFPPFRTKSKVNTTTSVPAKPTVESASDSSGAPTPLNPADIGLGEPMDLAPDNGIPIPPPAPTFTVPGPRFVAPTDTLDLSSLTHHLPETHTATLSLYPSLKPHIPITTTSPPPSPPKIPRIPEEISLNAYNRLFHTIGPYMAAWKLYEAEIQRRRELLLKEDIAAEGANMTKVMEGLSGYVNRVREYDMALDKAFEKAREKHLRGLEAWAELRRRVVAIGRRREAVDGASPAPNSSSASAGVKTEENEDKKKKPKEMKKEESNGNGKEMETKVKTEEVEENMNVKVDDLVGELVV